ncbi:MAG: FKBP-type peptidyl-prolyl cis-trans isomerase N-terminal domain-containing protein [Akkermansia sp.]
MKKHLLFLIICTGLVPVYGQDPLSTDLRNDIATLISLDASSTIKNIETQLGKSFDRNVFLEEYRKTLLSGQECPNPEETPCPAATEIANRILHWLNPEDFTPQEVFTQMNQQLAQAGKWSKEEQTQYQNTYTRVTKALQPILEAREITKEKNLLSMNAQRPGVKTLPNGIQYEIEPGQQNIHDINRVTTETGVAFYTRITKNSTFDHLPALIKQIADTLPTASSWTFYVPHEAVKAWEDEKANKAQSIEQKRKEKLQQLIPERVKEYERYEPKNESKDKAKKEQRHPLLRIKIWKDNPDAPVQVRPDCHEDSL